MGNQTTTKAQLFALEDWQTLATRWQALEKEAAPSFFTSWAWIGSLLKTTGKTPFLFALTEENGSQVRDLALALVGVGKRNGPLGATPCLKLNKTGHPQEERTWPEYNTLLMRPGFEEEALQAFFNVLQDRGSQIPTWSTLDLAGLEETTAAGVKASVKAEWHEGILSRHTLACLKEDLAPFSSLRNEASLEDWLTTVSANTRRQVARSLQLFEEEIGSLHLTLELDPVRQSEHLAQMTHWQAEKMGPASALADPFFQSFLKNLLETTSPKAHAELLVLSAGETPLGILFNFVCGGTVSNYQSAFRPFSDNRLKPGLVGHALSIIHYGQDGSHIYQFLAGDQRYKRSLSTGADRLVWLELRKPTLRLRLETFARNLKARLNQ